MFELESIIRNNIKVLKPYSSARDEFKGEASVYLDANENGYGSPLTEKFNRYPDPLQSEVKNALSKINGLPRENIFLGNGSDEAIDILYRIFCEPGSDNVIICPPTYGMYEVCANINDIETRKINLLPSFDLDVQSILANMDIHSKLLFICSPNNPTGNSMNTEDIELLIQKFTGIVVVDEAYINFSQQASCIKLLTEYSNLVVLQTFSKAWGLAGLRLGMAFASGAIINYMNKVKPPYNVNQPTQQLALKAINNVHWVNVQVANILEQRKILEAELKNISFIENVYPSNANFLLVKVKDANKVYQLLMEQGIIVRNRNQVILCQNCLRLTIGTAEENTVLITALQQIQL